MPEIQQIVDGLNCFTTKQHKCIGCPFHPGADKSRDFPYGCIRGQNEIVRAAQEALGKLNAKAPVFKTGETPVFAEYEDGTGGVEIHKWADWTCPECGWFVGEQYIPRRHNQQKCNFCSRCGQKIDWGAVDQNRRSMG